MTIKTETIIEKYVELRDKRSDLAKRFKEKDDELKGMMDKLEGHLLARMNDAGSDSFKTAAGTCYVQTTMKPSCADWPQFWGWMLENQRPDMQEKRISSSAVKEYKEEHGDYPPFLNVVIEREARVRRA